jgi:hypothetical protein
MICVGTGQLFLGRTPAEWEWLLVKVCLSSANHCKMTALSDSHEN